MISILARIGTRAVLRMGSTLASSQHGSARFPPSAAAKLVRAARNLVRSSTSVKRAKVLSAGDQPILWQGDGFGRPMTLQPKPQPEPNVSSRDEFPRLVLKLIADLSPCTEPTLFIEAVLQGLQKFAPGTLVEFRKLLGQCVDKLQSGGYVRLDGKHFVIVAAGKSDEAEILELTTVAEDIFELTDVVGTAEEEDRGPTSRVGPSARPPR